MQKKSRDRANRSKRALLKEQKDFGFISDGSGKRYRIPVDYVVAGDIKKAEEFIRWFEDQFSDDVGEPIFLLYSALTYFRLQEYQKARSYLLDTMLSNIYLLPVLFSKPIAKIDMWHSTSWEYPEYVQELNEYLNEPTSQERVWFQEEFESRLFTEVREKYIKTYRELDYERDIATRRRILDEWRKFRANIRANEI